MKLLKRNEKLLVDRPTWLFHSGPLGKDLALIAFGALGDGATEQHQRADLLVAHLLVELGEVSHELAQRARLRHLREGVDRVAGGPFDREGVVEFEAFYRDAEGRGSLRERSDCRRFMW